MNTNQVIVTNDVFHANGELKVAKGATGRVSSNDQGYCSVVFDSNQAAYVKPGFNRRLTQEVPARLTTTLAFILPVEEQTAVFPGDVAFSGKAFVYEVGPRCEDGGEVIPAEDGETPHFWAIYKRPVDGGLAEWVADHDSGDKALIVAQALAGLDTKATA